jgi:hypothetical protein
MADLAFTARDLQSFIKALGGAVRNPMHPQDEIASRRDFGTAESGFLIRCHEYETLTFAWDRRLVGQL